MITQRQPGPAIDGILGQALSKIARVYTDTHGFSAYGASLGWTLGILMCPRLKNFNDRRLHVPIPDNLRDVVLPDISLKSIEKGWAGHLKVADAVMSGRLSATTAIELQGAASHGDASFRAGHAHGLLLRTNDLLRSYTDPDYRDARSCAISITTNAPIYCSDSGGARRDGMDSKARSPPRYSRDDHRRLPTASWAPDVPHSNCTG